MKHRKLWNSKVKKVREPEDMDTCGVKGDFGIVKVNKNPAPIPYAAHKGSSNTARLSGLELLPQLRPGSYGSSIPPSIMFHVKKTKFIVFLNTTLQGSGTMRRRSAEKFFKTCNTVMAAIGRYIFSKST